MTPLDMREFLKSYPKLTEGIQGDELVYKALNKVAKRAGFREIDDDEPAYDALDELHQFILDNVKPE